MLLNYSVISENKLSFKSCPLDFLCNLKSKMVKVVVFGKIYVRMKYMKNDILLKFFCIYVPCTKQRTKHWTLMDMWVWCDIAFTFKGLTV